MKIAILIGLDGKPKFRLKASSFESQASPSFEAWLIHGGRLWGFGVAWLSGEHFFYEVAS